jgi:quercetin dioxygenase-like cupin family protein
MESISLTAVVDEQLDAARKAHSGRAAHTVHGGHDHSLRQTVIALAAGHELGEHTSPGEATLQVLRGHVRLSVGEDSVDGSAGDYLVIPRQRHALLAVDDSAVLLTVLTDQ